MENGYSKLIDDILYAYDRCTPTRISSLRENQIFVFGTDKKGSQKYGAAGMAAKRFGAQVGVVDGPTGMCYALPTMGFTEDELSHAVVRFEQYVKEHTQYKFLVTAVGCGHAGFNVNRVANMFKGLLGVTNVMFPVQFLNVYKEECLNSHERPMTVSVETEEKQVETENELNNKAFLYYDKKVHNVIRYLVENEIPFIEEGGYALLDSNEKVIAEAELGIETEKIVLYPFNSQSAMTFKNFGYKIMTADEYLESKDL